MKYLSILAAVAACLSAGPGRAADAPPAPVDFDRQVRPVLSDTCFTCHGPDERNRKADLRLDTKAGAFADLGGYHAIVPGDPGRSELYRRITSADKFERMPPAKAHKQLKPAEIDLIRRWIEQGAVWEEHWSFVAPTRPEPPKVKAADWPVNPIDHFVLARLEQEGLRPSPPESREKLLRRASLDLTGLPPTVAELDAFLADECPDAYEKAVDRLLASPRYGEHMALAWLDAARYSDTNGYQQDRTRTMWPWRDWVIGALNSNMPFDRFTVWQLAGDLLPDATPEQLLATGFHRNHMLNGEGGRLAEESRVEYVVDRVETTATVWLGLTMGCARCHSHKYDPVSQKEFYKFYAFFNNVDEVGGVDAGGNAKPVMQLPTPQQREQEADLRRQIAELEQRRNAADAEAGKKLEADLAAARKKLEALGKDVLEVMVMRERSEVRPTYRLERGTWNKPDTSEKLTPGTPSVLPPLPAGAPADRLALARWLVSPDNPLTARVTVNRYWQHFFGTGLVKTPEDFGSQGERPTHPQLLDWLAVEFVQSGWDVKHVHKLIVTSATYRQSSRTTPESSERDPYNVLLSRAPRFRLSSLAIRDQALALGGLLVEKVGGPPVKPYQPDGVWYDLSLGKIRYEKDSGEAVYRRSLYTFWRRSVGPTMYFDTPARQVCTVRVTRTNTPLHALTLLNDTTYVEAARAFAQRVIRDGGPTPEGRLALAFRAATGRRPGDKELQTLVRVYRTVLAKYQQAPAEARELIAVGDSRPDPALDPVELAAYTGVCNVILNLDEVITRE